MEVRVALAATATDDQILLPFVRDMLHYSNCRMTFRTPRGGGLSSFVLLSGFGRCNHVVILGSTGLPLQSGTQRKNCPLSGKSEESAQNIDEIHVPVGLAHPQRLDAQTMKHGTNEEKDDTKPGSQQPDAHVTRYGGGAGHEASHRQADETAQRRANPVDC